MPHLIIDEQTDSIPQWEHVDDAEPPPFSSIAGNVIPKRDLAVSASLGAETGRGYEGDIVEMLGKEFWPALYNALSSTS